MKKCKHPKCKNNAAPNRNECNSCKHRTWKDKNRLVFMWYMLKKSAKKRGYDFDLPKEWFVNFAISTGLAVNSGRLAHCFTVDRIRNDVGYIVGNLQVLTKSQNSTKFHEEDKKLLRKYNFAVDDETAPF